MITRLLPLPPTLHVCPVLCLVLNYQYTFLACLTSVLVFGASRRITTRIVLLRYFTLVLLITNGHHALLVCINIVTR